LGQVGNKKTYIMKITVKLIWSIVILVVGLVVALLFQAFFVQQGRASILLGLIFVGIIWAIISVWKKKSPDNKSTDLGKPSNDLDRTD